MAVMAFSDSRQVVAISTLGTLAEGELATPGLATIRQNRLAARSLPFVVHDTAGFSGRTSSFGLIVRLLLSAISLAQYEDCQEGMPDGRCLVHGVR
jgi:hypothetical protein